MARAIRHRGPDGFGIATGNGAGLVSTRLAIIDLDAGWQPMRGERSAIVFNGEVYNHRELRADLGTRVCDWQTDCDTEVVLRLLELDGLGALDDMNGQFAIAWWEPAPRRLTLVRDRFGVRPLYYAALPDGGLVFGSEAKALFASGAVAPEADLAGIDEVFHLWGAIPPATPFRGVRQVRPGGLVVWEDGRIVADRTWWTPDVTGGRPNDVGLEELVRDSVRLRLRADVTVRDPTCSGGLDSSVITAIAVQEAGEPVEAFSVAFRDEEFDEGEQQRDVARALGVRHHQLTIEDADIAAAFLDTIWHTETPSVRTARSRSGCSPARSATPASSWSPRARARTSSSGATTSSRRRKSGRSACASRARRRGPRCSTASTPTWAGASWARPSGGARSPAPATPVIRSSPTSRASPRPARCAASTAPRCARSSMPATPWPA